MNRGLDRRRVAGSVGQALALLGIAVLGRLGAAEPVQELPDPARVSGRQFLAVVDVLRQRLEQSTEAGLEPDTIEWLLEAEGSLRARGLRLRGQSDRFRLLAQAYERAQDYGHALEFFVRAKDQCGIEAADWLWRHEGMRPPFFVQMRPLHGPMPDCGSMAHRSQTAVELFVAFDSGVVYQYEKRQNERAVIVVLPDRRMRPARLSLDNGGKLKIALEDGTRYRFDTRRTYLEPLPALGIHRIGQRTEPDRD